MRPAVRWEEAPAHAEPGSAATETVRPGNAKDEHRTPGLRDLGRDLPRRCAGCGGQPQPRACGVVAGRDPVRRRGAVRRAGCPLPRRRAGHRLRRRHRRAVPVRHHAARRRPHRAPRRRADRRAADPRRQSSASPCWPCRSWRSCRRPTPTATSSRPGRSACSAPPPRLRTSTSPRSARCSSPTTSSRSRSPRCSS